MDRLAGDNPKTPACRQTFSSEQAFVALGSGVGNLKIACQHSSTGYVFNEHSIHCGHRVFLSKFTRQD
jgi:hypothetical protein